MNAGMTNNTRRTLKLLIPSTDRPFAPAFLRGPVLYNARSYHVQADFIKITEKAKPRRASRMGGIMCASNKESSSFIKI